MSDFYKRLDEATMTNKEALAVPCSKCGAKAGEFCHWGHGLGNLEACHMRRLGYASRIIPNAGKQSSTEGELAMTPKEKVLAICPKAEVWMATDNEFWVSYSAYHIDYGYGETEAAAWQDAASKLPDAGKQSTTEAVRPPWVSSPEVEKRLVAEAEALADGMDKQSSMDGELCGHLVYIDPRTKEPCRRCYGTGFMKPWPDSKGLVACGICRAEERSTPNSSQLQAVRGEVPTHPNPFLIEGREDIGRVYRADEMNAYLSKLPPAMEEELAWADPETYTEFIASQLPADKKDESASDIPKQDEEQNLRYLTQLVEELAKKHYPEITQFKPLYGDIFGLLLQIDNMTYGLSRAPSNPAGDELPPCSNPECVSVDALREVLEVLKAERAASQGKTALIENLKSQRSAAMSVEKGDCGKALGALAGAHICTPEETYGFNTSWAISDLCRAVTKQYEELAYWEGRTEATWAREDAEVIPKLDLVNRLKKAEQELATLRARETAWIDVKQELPPFGERVLAYSPANKHQGSRYFVTSLHVYSGKKDMIWLDEDINEYATHWQYLSEAPTPKESK